MIYSHVPISVRHRCSDGQCIRQRLMYVGAVCVEAGLIQIMLGPTTKKIRRSDGKWLVIEITIANIVRRARFDKFDLARTAIARTRDPARLGSARLGSAWHSTALFAT